MKVFSKIPVRHHYLATDQVEVRTHYYLFDWNFWTSRRQEAIGTMEIIKAKCRWTIRNR